MKILVTQNTWPGKKFLEHITNGTIITWITTIINKLCYCSSFHLLTPPPSSHSWTPPSFLSLVEARLVSTLRYIGDIWGWGLMGHSLVQTPVAPRQWLYIHTQKELSPSYWWAFVHVCGAWTSGSMQELAANHFWWRRKL